tara:strand:+ start:608 stop:1627 length:1020 start_codon:yes stop_codon:yes gene_type:complete
MRKNILFCGTPEFAIPALNTLIRYQDELGYNLTGVITIPDRISGRGQKKQEAPIKKEAKKNKLKIFTPTDLSDPVFINSIHNLNLDIILVVAFRKLPSILFNIPNIGTVNLHASLLPQYRGAAPINWVIINGEEKTGLTTFFINEKIDTGDIIIQEEIDILQHWHAHHLHEELMKKSAKILKLTIQKLLSNNYVVHKQNVLDNKQLKYAPKIHKQDLIIKWENWNSKKLVDIYNFIRGMSPPGVKTVLFIQDQNKKIIKKHISITELGSFKKTSNFNKNITIKISESYNEIILTKENDYFLIKKIKLDNGKELNTSDFINGFLKKKNHINNLFLKSPTD